jgi:hypothetical protein
VPCGGYKGKVKRKVTLQREGFRPLTKEQIWAGRDNFLKGDMGAFRKYQQIEMHNRTRNREYAEDVSDFDRTYFMEAPDNEDKSYNRCPELFCPLEPHDIPESEISCSYCKLPWFFESGDGSHLSHEAIRLPCGHIFGQECILGWMGQHKIPTCLVCTQRYKAVHEMVDEDWENWLPNGYAEQKVVDFSPNTDIHRLKVSLIHAFHLKLLVVAVLFAPPPVCVFSPSRFRFINRTLLTKVQFTSRTNFFMLTIGAVLFWQSFIHLPTGAPSSSPRERIIQNRFVICSAIGNSIELLIARLNGTSRYSLLAYPFLSWVMLEILRKILPSLGWDFRLNLSLPDSRLQSPFDRAFVALEPEDVDLDEGAIGEEWEDELVDDGLEYEERLR